MAVGSYGALKQLGLKIPDDVSVVGFDDDEIASQLMPKLTILKFPPHLMGAWAAERVLTFHGNREETCRVVKLECELVEREPVAPPGQRSAMAKRRAVAAR